MASFADALDTNVADIEAAPSQPVGTYLWEIYKDFEIKDRGEDWEVISFPIKCVSAEDDVDPDELEEFGSVTGEVQRYEFMSPKEPGVEGERKRQNTRNQIKKFCLDVLQLPDEGSLKDLMSAAKGSQFLAQVSHREYNGEIQIDVKRGMPAD